MAIGSAPISKSDLSTPSGLNVLERGLRKVFFDIYDLMDDQYSQIFTEVGSSKGTETDQVMYGFSQFPVKSEGAPLNYDSAGSAWNKLYTHEEFQLGYAVTRIAREDELYGYLNRLPAALARSAQYTREVNAMTLFNNLAATVYAAGGSNYTLLSTTHFRADGGVRSNTFAVPMDLSIEALGSGLALFRTQMLDQRGLKYNVQPEILLVGPSDEMLAYRLVESEFQPQGNDNDINAVKRHRRLRVMVSDFMTDDGRWFLLAPKDRTALVYFNKEPVTNDRFDDVNTGNMNMSARYRSSSGATDITGVFGST